MPDAYPSVDESRDRLRRAGWSLGEACFGSTWQVDGRNGENVLVATGGFFDVRGIKIPVAVSAFSDEIYQAPKSWAEKAYPKLLHYGRFDKGTHFAAWEQTDLFVQEMRASFKSFRKSA